MTRIFLILIVVLVSATGCYSHYPSNYRGLRGQVKWQRMMRGQRQYRQQQLMHRYAPPSSVGFLDGPSIICQRDNPRCLRITNDTDNYYARCWLDSTEILPTMRGGHIQMPILTRGGIATKPVLAPRDEMSILVDVGLHHIQCELYVDGVPLQRAYYWSDRKRANRNGLHIQLHPRFMRDASKYAVK